ncbi:MAG: dihydroorotase [Clostridia bacterium]
MSRDIYSKYLESLKGKSAKVDLKKADPEKALDNSSDAVTILKEISSKLDRFEDRSPAYGSPQSLGSTGMDMDLAIVNGSVVLPDNGVFKCDVYIRDGKIHSLGSGGNIKAKEVIDATGKYVIPGVIDPHVHLGLCAPLEKELETETKSALLGGITTIGCHFNGTGSYFNTFPAIMGTIEERSYTDVIPHFVISSSEQCREILDYINHLGITSFKIYMNGIPGMIDDVDDGFILDVFEQIKKSPKKCIVCSHAENRDIVRNAYKKVKAEKGDTASITDWTETHPDIAEEEAAVRISYLAQKMGVPIYLVHISSALAINALRKIKPFNKYVNIETTSPYLSITRQSALGNYIKMEPPFRDAKDMEELWSAVSDDIADTIGTDNVTMTKAEKRAGSTIWDVVPGYPALETHLPVLLNEGVIKRGIPIEKVISKITKRPAEVFNVYPQKGTLLPGSDADAVIIDMDMKKEIRASELHSRSDFSIYEGKILQGWPVTTIKSGQVVVKDGKYIGQNAKGVCISR